MYQENVFVVPLPAGSRGSHGFLGLELGGDGDWKSRKAFHQCGCCAGGRLPNGVLVSHAADHGAFFG